MQTLQEEIVKYRKSLKEDMATTISINVPFVKKFDDYHEIGIVKNTINGVSSGIKLKASEAGIHHGQYVGVFWASNQNMTKELVQKLLEEQGWGDTK